jgi:GNAT superfamily N-acetyltransferase
MVSVVPLDPARAERLAAWTFPAYRHLLALEPAERNPSHGDRRHVRPIALVGEDEDGEVAGLVLGALPAAEEDVAARPAELLSVFVHPERRRQGMAGILLARLEREVRAAGARRIETVYMTGGAAEIVERLLAARGWSAPETRMSVVRFTIDEAKSTPWFGRYRWRSQTEYAPWVEVTDEEIERLRASHRASGWITEDLVPWQFDRAGVEPHSSLAIRRRGEIVGWVINHRMPDGTVRFTCSYIHPDLKRRGRILPAYTESVRRVADAGYSRCVFTVPAHHPEMVAFVERWAARWVGFVGETRGSSKELASGG